MKLLPENKTFLIIVLAAILLLAGVKVVLDRTAATSTATQGNSGENFKELFDLVKRENIIRSRHDGLIRANKQWQKVFLHGEKLDACLTLLGYTGDWIKESKMKNEATRMLLDMPAKGGLPMVGLELRGSSSFASIRDFLALVEDAPIVVTVEQLHLEKAKEDKSVRFQIRIVALTLNKKGVAKP